MWLPNRLQLLVILLLMSPGSASADFPLSVYDQFKDSQPFQHYMVGVGRGIFWATVATTVRGGPRLFCLPDHLALDAGLVHSLLDQEIRKPLGRPSYSPDTPLELILTNAFVSRFPCPKSQ